MFCYMVVIYESELNGLKVIYPIATYREKLILNVIRFTSISLISEASIGIFRRFALSELS